MRIINRTVHEIEVEGATVELEFEPSSGDDILTEIVGDVLVVAYLVYDTNPGSVEDLMGDCMGELLSFHRRAGAKQREKGLAALGRDRSGDTDEDITPDKDAVLLDCYDHSGQRWSVSGRGMQCQWDTSSGAGVWVPDEDLRSQIDSDVLRGGDRRARAVVYCGQFLEGYNAILSGDVYSLVTQTYRRKTSPVPEEGEDFCWLEVGSSDAYWGVIGHKYAKEALKSEYLDAPVAQLKKEQVTA